MNRTLNIIFLFTIISIFSISAQEFDFGNEANGNEGSASFFKGKLDVSIGGEVSAVITGYFDDISKGAEKTKLGDIFSGKLKFIAKTDSAEGFICFKLRPTELPMIIDEGYVQAYFGSFDIETGLRKLTWGKADSTGPLDVINPQDYSDLSDIMNQKIARLLVHASLLLGRFSKIEAVFVPNFVPLRFAESGRWLPPQFELLNQLPAGSIIYPDTTTINYAQAGLRFTTIISGAIDVGVQYYYGRLTTPTVTLSMSQFATPVATLTYNPYHQIGLDYAQVIAGFNLRAEFATNITEDIKGNDSSVYNPFLAWSLGFDRNLLWGINLNLQCNEKIRLFNDKINNPMDIEADSTITTTSITAVLSKKFMRDELEIRGTTFWEVEGSSCLIIPSIIWTNNDVSIELSAGIFIGKNEGFLGQFHDNSFVKLRLIYTF